MNIKYVGKLKFSVMRGNKCVCEAYTHNSAEIGMARLFAYALAGKSQSVLSCTPSYVDITEESSGMSIIYQNIPISGLRYSEIGWWEDESSEKHQPSAFLDFVMTYENLSQKITSFRGLIITLYSSRGEKMATCSLNEIDTILSSVNFVKGMQINVSWQLMISPTD